MIYVDNTCPYLSTVVKGRAKRIPGYPERKKKKKSLIGIFVKTGHQEQKSLMNNVSIFL